MLKKSENPLIAELTLSTRERRLNLSDLSAVLVEDKKCCAWCLTPLKGRQIKWCSKDCSNSAFAWANPQKEEGLQVLLVRQDFQCADCKFDYKPFLSDALTYFNRKRVTIDPNSVNTVFSPRLMKVLKYKVPSDRLPEVDHIVPISKGGQAIGLDNHNALCYSCHKTKTKVDNSGPRKKKVKDGNPEGLES